MIHYHGRPGRMSTRRSRRLVSSAGVTRDANDSFGVRLGRSWPIVVVTLLFLGGQGLLIWYNAGRRNVGKAVEERSEWDMGAWIRKRRQIAEGGDWLKTELMTSGRKVVAFAVTITKDGHHMDGAAVLATSIYMACVQSMYLCDLVAFVHEDARKSGAILSQLGFRVMKMPLPVALSEIKDERTREYVETGGCCGPAELLKLYSYTLTEYHRVVHLDTDTLVLRHFDELMESNASLLYTEDVNMAGPKRSPVIPLQGGFMVVQPNKQVFEDVLEVVRSTPFKRGLGWGSSKIGLFWGGITVQGLLPYFYESRGIREDWEAVDRCKYNNMVDTSTCRETDLETIRSVHFTNCQKPWVCYYPHPKHQLCSRLFEQWYWMRKEAERALGIPSAKACVGVGERSYRPMKFDLLAQ
ncbi:unnamed protein product [Discosporangium mesarthrocarpum]